MTKRIEIGRHTIGMDRPTYFIVDIAANHDGSLERAKDLIHIAAEAGANAAKFQNFLASTIVSDHGFGALNGQQSHQASWGKSVYDIYEDASLSMDWTAELRQACDDAEIDYFTAPYDLTLLDELSKHVCAWKVGSGDITWLENIEAMARYDLPILIATGAAEMEDVTRAVETAHRFNNRIVLMQCNTNYTGNLENFHHIALNVLKAYARAFPDTVLGLSDHTPGHATVLGAVALGARVIEKHFTDSKNRDGPDHGFSMEPAEWREMVERTRELEAALGSEEKRVMDNEVETVVLQRRAIRTRKAINSGAIIGPDDVFPLRPCPADALPPYRLGEVVGRRTSRNLEAGACVRLTDLE